jgi:hypothetical protein
MKNFFLALLSFLIVSFSADAQGRRGAIQVQLVDGRPLTLVINGRNYEARGRSITIGDLIYGRHNIQVFALRGRRGQTAQLVYRGRVPVDAGSTTVVTVDPSRRAARIQLTGGRDNRSRGWNSDEWYSSRDEDDDRDSRRGRFEDDNYRDRDTRGNSMLTDRDIDDLRDRVSQRSIDADKLSLIKSVISDRSYTTDQVRTMASLLSFESSKLELAKAAYAGVSDPRNYWKLDDIFTFDASKQELNEYTSRRQ